MFIYLLFRVIIIMSFFGLGKKSFDELTSEEINIS